MQQPAAAWAETDRAATADMAIAAAHIAGAHGAPGGKFPPAEANGVRYLTIPVTLKGGAQTCV